MKTKISIMVIAVMVLCLFSISTAQVPKMINYQGKLTKAGTCALDTTIAMTFKIYGSLEGTDSLWWETQNSVVVEDGIFNVLLGSVNNIPDSVFTGSTRYLGIKVGGDPEMVPRKEIVSVGYAYKAVNADTAEYALAGGGGIGGSGTTNYIAKFTGSTTIGNSVIYESSSNVGIGTISPAYKLDVSGNADAVVNATNSYTTGTPKAIFGLASPATGQTRGVWGQTNSSTDYAVGVLGLANAGSGMTMGVYGKTNSSAAGASGVYGITSSGATYGVKGYTTSTTNGNAGVYGHADGSGANYGVYGRTESSSGYGVYGRAPAGGYGLYSEGAMRATGQISSTVATGTAPLAVSSTTLNTNLNADMVDNYHAGNSSGQVGVSNGTVCTNLNADMLDGKHASDIADDGVKIGKIYLSSSGTILSTDGGTRVLYWDATNGEIEITNTSGDWCDYWWQSQKGATTAGGSSATANGTSNVVIISGTNSNDYGFEVHFGQADWTEGWCSVWLQYANGALVGHYIKY